MEKKLEDRFIEIDSSRQESETNLLRKLGEKYVSYCPSQTYPVITSSDLSFLGEATKVNFGNREVSLPKYGIFQVDRPEMNIDFIRTKDYAYNGIEKVIEELDRVESGKAYRAWASQFSDEEFLLQVVKGGAKCIAGFFLGAVGSKYLGSFGLLAGLTLPFIASSVLKGIYQGIYRLTDEGKALYYGFRVYSGTMYKDYYRDSDVPLPEMLEKILRHGLEIPNQEKKRHSPKSPLSENLKRKLDGACGLLKESQDDEKIIIKKRFTILPYLLSLLEIPKIGTRYHVELEDLAENPVIPQSLINGIDRAKNNFGRFYYITEVDKESWRTDPLYFSRMSVQTNGGVQSVENKTIIVVGATEKSCHYITHFESN